MQRIVVIDYGMGNLRSVSKALEWVAPDDEVLVTSNPSLIESADRIVCPGQGAAADCMAALARNDLSRVVVDLIGTRPFLGICMGFQVLLTESEENQGVRCLGQIDGCARRFDEPLLSESGKRLKVPHMGWSKVRQTRDHALWAGVPNDARFYFAHSYYCDPADTSIVTGRCQYGRDIAVSVAKPGLFACQFHPEKSARDGLQLLQNFSRWQL